MDANSQNWRRLVALLAHSARPAFIHSLGSVSGHDPDHLAKIENVREANVLPFRRLTGR